MTWPLLPSGISNVSSLMFRMDPKRCIANPEMGYSTLGCTVFECLERYIHHLTKGFVTFLLQQDAKLV
jgi:hypothetical protein